MKEVRLDDPKTYAIIGAAIAVHRELGHGFLESVYHEALALEFATRQIPCQREVDLPVNYKGTVLPCPFRADFLCYEHVIVELKAVDQLSSSHQARVLNYLKAAGFHIGLLINFGSPRLQYRRYVWDDQHERKND